MFYYASDFDQDLNGWDPSDMRDWYDMTRVGGVFIFPGVFPSGRARSS